MNENPIYTTVANVLGAAASTTTAALEATFYVRYSDGDDGDGSAGMREPRRPVPAAPAGTMVLAL